MLVLTRKLNETIQFPELDISVNILSMGNAKVRIGIDAPLEIKVIRGELARQESMDENPRSLRLKSDSEHALRNILNDLKVATSLTKKLIENGKTGFAATVLNNALNELGSGSVEDIEIESPSSFTSCKARALLVEDVTNEREMLAGFLRLHGYQTDTVGDGLDCLDYIDTNDAPDFILMDMNLPRLHGADTIRKLRESPHCDDIKIYAVSGDSPESAGIDTQANRIENWFQKPLEPQVLILELDQQFGLMNNSVS